MGVKLITSFILIILVMCSCIVAGEISDRGWSIPQPILKDIPSNFFSITGGSDGSWNLIYFGAHYDDDFSYPLKYLNSNSEHYNITETGVPYFFSTDMGPDGRLHVAYISDNYEEPTIDYIYKDNQGQWSAPQPILRDIPSNFFSITGGSDGSWNLIFANSSDDGFSCSLEYLNSNSENYTILETGIICPSFIPTLFTDMGSDGRLHVAYLSANYEEPTIDYVYKDNQGQWSAPQPILKDIPSNFFSITGGSDGSWNLIYDFSCSLEYLNSNSEHYTILETGIICPSSIPTFSTDMGSDGRLHVAYLSANYEEPTIDYVYKTTDKLRLLIIPVNWQGSYESFKTKAEEIGDYYLNRTPLKDCPEQFEVLISEKEDYGNNWHNWYCYDLKMIPPNCNDFGLLAIIDKCAKQYWGRTNTKYDFVAGITDRDLKEWNKTGKPVEPNCDSGIAGWSDGKSKIPTIIAESTVPGIVTHELGHEFGLADQYCDCSPVLNDTNPFNNYLADYCGPKGDIINPLKAELGCDTSTCCWGYGNGPYDPICGWCDGNFDRHGEDTDTDGVLDYGQRSTMSNKILYPFYETGHYYINGYAHLETISQFKCDSSIYGITTISTTTNNEITSVYADPLLTVSLIVFDNDTVIPDRIDLSSGYTPIIYPEYGNYSLRILDQSNDTVYERNMSIHFILFSDPPEIVDYSYVYDKIPFYNSMNKLELYHGDNLIFSHELDFCNYDDSCDENEHYYSCPSDCLPYGEDGICNNEEDGGCDLDCLPGIDPDCSIFLKPGLNLISIPFNVSNKTADWLCDQINCSFIFAFPNQTWRYYDPTKPVNTLYDIDGKIGIWIKVNESLELNLEGSAFENAEINLSEGWNLVGYPFLYTSLINETLLANSSLIYGYKDGEWNSYVKERDDSLNTLKSFVPGYGYWVEK